MIKVIEINHEMMDDMFLLNGIDLKQEMVEDLFSRGKIPKGTIIIRWKYYGYGPFTSKKFYSKNPHES